MPISLRFSNLEFKRTQTERNYVIRIVRHSETPQRRQFDLGRDGVRTLARQGSSKATQRRHTGRVFRIRSEKPANRGERFVQLAARGLIRAQGAAGVGAQAANPDRG